MKLNHNITTTQSGSENRGVSTVQIGVLRVFRTATQKR